MTTLRADMRVLVIGGMLSFRALFNWLSPWIYIPSLLVTPIVQILLFAYMGRAAGVGSDSFYVIGNAIQYAALPCLFAMGKTIAGERSTETLGLVLATPASRVSLFVGRSLPVILNGWLVSMISLVAGSLLLHVMPPPRSWLPLALVAAVASVSCTGLGLANAALGLRVRETAVTSNVLFGVLLIFSGANVAVAQLPHWMAVTSHWLPLSHAVEAARDLAAGATLASIGGLLWREAVLAAVYGAAGLGALRWLERESRRRATLEMA